MYPTFRARATGARARFRVQGAAGLVVCALMFPPATSAAPPEPVPPADAPTANECRGFEPCVTVKTGPQVVPPGSDLGVAHSCPEETPNLVSWDIQGDPEVVAGVRKLLVGADGRPAGIRFYLQQEDDQRPATVELVLGCSSERVVLSHSIEQHGTGAVPPLVKPETKP